MDTKETTVQFLMRIKDCKCDQVCSALIKTRMIKCPTCGGVTTVKVITCSKHKYCGITTNKCRICDGEIVFTTDIKLPPLIKQNFIKKQVQTGSGDQNETKQNQTYQARQQEKKKIK